MKKKFQSNKNIQKKKLLKKNKMNDKKSKESSFIDHLTELRSRLFKSIIYIFIFFVVSYTFAENIYGFLVQPYADAVKDDDLNRRLIFTALHETFITYLKVAFFCCNLYWQSCSINANMEIYSSRII